MFQDCPGSTDLPVASLEFFLPRLLVKTLAGDQTISQCFNSVVLLKDQVQEKRNEIMIIKCYGNVILTREINLFS